jgi:predicted DNA-binding transcriptional regulator AlpA
VRLQRYWSSTVEKPTIEKMAVSIPQAAQIVGVSRAKFYSMWINEGLVKPVDLGARGRSVLLEELKAAIYARAHQQRKAG